MKQRFLELLFVTVVRASVCFFPTSVWEWGRAATTDPKEKLKKKKKKWAVTVLANVISSLKATPLWLGVNEQHVEEQSLCHWKTVWLVIRPHCLLLFDQWIVLNDPHESLIRSLFASLDFSRGHKKKEKPPDSQTTASSAPQSAASCVLKSTYHTVSVPLVMSQQAVIQRADVFSWHDRHKIMLR